MNDQIDDNPPPKHRYKLVIEIGADSHEDLMSEVLSITRGRYLIASDYYKRDEIDSTDGTTTIRLYHTNPGQTREKYLEELDIWLNKRKEQRKKGKE